MMFSIYPNVSGFPQLVHMRAKGKQTKYFGLKHIDFLFLDYTNFALETNCFQIYLNEKYDLLYSKCLNLKQNVLK